MLFKKIQKAKKLKALADRGFGSEKDSARRFYEEYLKKHNLTENDVEPNRYNRKIRLKDKDYEVFLNHVILSVNPFITIDKKKGCYEVNLDDADYLEVMERTDFFHKAFKSEKELFFVAFMEKFKSYFLPDEESVEKHKDSMNKPTNHTIFNNIQKNETPEVSSAEVSQSENKFDKRKIMKVHYFKQLISDLKYTKTNRRL